MIKFNYPSKYLIIFWVSYIIYNTIYFAIAYEFYLHPIVAVLYYTSLFCVFYFTFLAIDLFKRNNYIFSFSLIIVGYFISFCTLYIIDYRPQLIFVDIPIRSDTLFHFFLSYVIEILSISFWSGAFYIYFDKKNYLNSIIKLQKLNNSIEQKTNRLNGQYNIIEIEMKELNEIAEEKAKPIVNDIKALTSLMDYYINFDSTHLILLELELLNTHNYVALNQKRFNEKFNIQFETIGNIENILIPHLSIITLVENAFKHGDLVSDSLKILILIEKNNLNIKITNKVGIKTHNSTKIGLINLENRLKLLYNSNYNFKTYERNNYFTAELITYN